MKKNAAKNTNSDIRDMFSMKTNKKKTSKNNTRKRVRSSKLITNFMSTHNVNYLSKLSHDNFPDNKLRIWSWNINGFRPAITKNYLLNFIRIGKHDFILILQI